MKFDMRMNTGQKDLEVREHLIDLGVDGTLILMWIFKN
jgi:hypothetical protein